MSKNGDSCKSIEVKEDQRNESFIVEHDEKRFKIYVDKVGYDWKNESGSGLAKRIRIMCKELDFYGDPKANKSKQVNLPFMNEDEISLLNKLILRAQSQELENGEV